MSKKDELLPSASMTQNFLLCGVFLDELAVRHKVDVNKLVVGKMGKDLHIWRYDTGAYDVWKVLEIVSLNAHNGKILAKAGN